MVVAMLGVIRVLVVGQLPVSQVIGIERQFVADSTPFDVPVVPLEALRQSGALGPVAAALAERLQQRAADESQ
jgi:hypothetical protein